MNTLFKILFAGAVGLGTLLLYVALVIGIFAGSAWAILWILRSWGVL